MLLHQCWFGLGPAVFIRENRWSAPRQCARDADQMDVGQPTDPGEGLRGDNMAAMKPRTGDGPLEVTKEGRGIVMRVPLEGGGRLVVEMTPDEANALGDALKAAAG
jgi:hypothetical protein